jgi:hypothetical protein
MSEHTDFFAAVPLRFHRAWEYGELDTQHVLIGFHVSVACYEARNTADGVAAIRLGAIAELTETSAETVRRKLHDLQRLGWIDLKAPDPGNARPGKSRSLA